ncbi:GldG family protein [Candidatus Levibacter sp. Uisw_134_01]|uniref:GldG family protein n=1 Tax=Candidatus Levibacter sp. Uisw_134_01 TaxID=3230999 RepID=UPI003D3A33B1
MNSFKNIKPRTLIKLSIVLSILIFFSINIITNNMLASSRIDFTENKLYSLSDGTKSLLKNLNEPIHIRLFISSNLVKDVPQLSTYANRVQTMLKTYRNISDGNITLEIIDPKPFSDAEDRAVGMGINSFNATEMSDALYFGLAATNSTTGQKNIPIFSPERETFLEYDLSSLISELSQINKPVISVIDNLGLKADSRIGKPEQQILTQMKQLFQVEMVNESVNTLNKATKVLMIIHPKYLSDETLYMIDQWVLKGGPTLIFLDPYAETEVSRQQGVPPINPRSNLKKLLNTWGIDFDDKKAVLDAEYGFRISRDINGRDIQVTNYPWLNIRGDGLKQNESSLSNLSTIVMTTAGSFVSNNEKIMLEPIITSSIKSGLGEAQKAGNPKGDPRDLLSDIKAKDQKHILSGWIKSDLKTSFQNFKKSNDTEQLMKSTNKSNILLVSDADMLMDRNWLTQRGAFANNGDFVLNVVEKMIGGNILSDLRGKGTSWRPFEKIISLEKIAEQKFQLQEQMLAKKLKGMEDKIRTLTQNNQNESDILSPETLKAIEGFKSEMMSTRSQLRTVKFDLRRDVETLKKWIISINVAILPIFFASIALLISLKRRRKKSY